jgi:hypothetical protein
MGKGRGGGGGGGQAPEPQWTSASNFASWPDYLAALQTYNTEKDNSNSNGFVYNSQTKNFVKNYKNTNFETFSTQPVTDSISIPYTVHERVTDDYGGTALFFGGSPQGENGPYYPERTEYAQISFDEAKGKSRDEVAGILSSRIGGIEWSEDNAIYNFASSQFDSIVGSSNANEENKTKNAAANDLTQKYNALRTKNEATNTLYDKAETTARASRGGDYVAQRNALSGLGATDAVKATFKDFYRDQKLQSWDANLGAKPAYGDFDPNYYKTQNPTIQQQWQNAVANDDIDITERYNENSFYLQNYTTQGKPAGLRGNAAEVTKASNAYLENPPTDADLQAVRDLQLGVDTATQSQRLLNIPEIAKQWEVAKNGDPYWDKLAKEKYLDVSKPDEFAALFRLSNRPEDKQVSLNYNINAGYGVTQLEDALNQAVGEKAIVDVKRFGALAQNVLKDSIKEMQKAKAKEQTLGLMKGFSGFNEIMDINKTLTNSILGDSGVGGVLSFTSAGKAEESLTKSLQNITGVQNNATYNWQQWFDTALKEKYNKDIELGYTTDQATEQVKIDGEFARSFIDTYLTPRFNTSRSMDEFVEYLDVRQEEQNPFQTQDILNATKLTADLRSKQYLDQIKSTAVRSFDPNFYFSPTGDKARETAYANQASTVAADWEAAKKGDTYWQQQAYRFGVDINDKAAFARMHFEVKGQGKGYDAADDILNASKVQDQIYSTILPALKDEALKQGTVFGLFVTPEEFADDMLRGLDPNDKSTWNEVLQRYGLTDFKGTVEELKQYVAETLRTGSAQDIREQIKYLNEKRQKPTQKVLGLTYIERPEDFKNEKAAADTELYKTFQSAGFQGTEDDFYKNFFPDVDRSEQSLLTKAGGNKALKTSGLDFSDPFASLGTIESFFADENAAEAKQDKSSSTDKTDTSDFFSLGSDEEDEDYKSATGQKILGEFTSMFKGL